MIVEHLLLPSLRPSVLPVVGTGELKPFHWSYGTDVDRRPEAKKIPVACAHRMSKRIALCTTHARARNSSGSAAALNNSITAPSTNSTAFDLHVRHILGFRSH